eukprot:m.45128 g.45128  ORF g.45128 m.45128 type:complete len:327 (-) comp12410_c0_seq1:300-1280(-)
MFQLQLLWRAASAAVFAKQSHGRLFNCSGSSVSARFGPRSISAPTSPSSSSQTTITKSNSTQEPHKTSATSTASVAARNPTSISSEPTSELQQRSRNVDDTPAWILRAKDPFTVYCDGSKGEVQKASTLFKQQCRFVKSCRAVSELPTTVVPEVVVLGRTNVGKSSLLSALMGHRSNLVRTSGQPGHTRHLNVFDVDGRVRLLDVPGYGYRSTEADMTMLGEYIMARREMLRLACLLIDGRHGVKPIDEYVVKLLEQSRVPYQIFLTKCDRASSPGEVHESVAQAKKFIVENCKCCHPDVQPVSSVSNGGIPQMRWYIYTVTRHIR